MRSLVYYFLPLIFFLITVIALAYLAKPGVLENAWFQIIGRGLLLGLLIFSLSLWFWKILWPLVKERKGINKFLFQFYLSFLMLLMLELIFNFVPRSHGYGFTLAARNWFAYYWAENELGYRDLALAEKNKRLPAIFFIGDSFTAGQGITNPKQRFSDLVKKRFAGKVETYNLGINGASTTDLLPRIQNYPREPDWIVWQYYGNDIEGVLEKEGLFYAAGQPYESMPRLLARPIQASYLLNYLYWGGLGIDTQQYHTYLINNFRDQEKWTQHKKEFGQIISYCQRKQIKLFLVLFPFLDDVEGSAAYFQRIIPVLDSSRVEYVDLREEIEVLELEQRVVNAQDYHPSEQVHRQVAQKIFSFLQPYVPRPKDNTE